jgi:DNA-binding MarR family transcriptional regulator
MSPAPPLTQSIGRTERSLRALLDLVLADTGGTFHQWVALNYTALSDGSIDRRELTGRLADALQTDPMTAEAAIAALEDEELLETVSASDVALTDSGRERYERIRDAIDQITAPLYGDLPPRDLTTARRVLSTISDRADILLLRR